MMTKILLFLYLEKVKKFQNDLHMTQTPVNDVWQSNKLGLNWAKLSSNWNWTFLQLGCATGPLHCENRSTCSQAFQSHIYADIKALNKEASKQFNHVLRSVQHSVMYMNDNYFTAMKVFISFHNMQGLKINKGM